MDFEFFRAQLENRFNKTYTDEQTEFIKDITVPTLVFADPGVGKSECVIAGLLCAELYHKVNPRNIYALSFTREATLELRNRHEKYCTKLGIGSLVNFKTLDSLCAEIIKEYCSVLSTEIWTIDDIKITESLSIEETAEFLLDAAEEMSISLNPRRVRDVVLAIRALNSSLIFDQAHVESKMIFKKTGLTYQDFQALRKRVYNMNKISKQVRVDDISLYTLEILTKRPDIAEKLKERHRIMVVDEFQDMSLIKLELLSRITDTLVAIGDMKQQIYAFNGACSEIVEMYRKYFPNRREVKMTKSFRCAQPIAEYAKKLILPNNMGGESFEGIDIKGASVNIYNSIDLDTICRGIKEEFVANRNVFPKDIMFLYRNNYTAIPVVEKLFEYRIPVIVSKHVEAHKLPVIKDLCALAEICRNPNSPFVMEILNKLVPEFYKFKDKPNKNPIVEIMRAEGKGFFDINYCFKDEDCGHLLYKCLRAAKKALDNNAMTRDVFNELYQFYNEYYLRDREQYLEQPAKYYIGLVVNMTGTKSYQRFVADELKKKEFIEDCIAKRLGLRCLTFHAAKGTEADIVYIIDADQGIIPNLRKLEETLKNSCLIDAAREIRNERCLVFVAATRAREQLNIYTRGELSSLFTERNDYLHLDRIYSTYRPNHNDVEVFSEFFKG